MSKIQIEDASSAQAAARRYMIAQLGLKKIKEISFSRTWYQTGVQRDIWEVEGDVSIKKGLFGKKDVHFKLQIDPEKGKVIAYEI